MIYELTKNYGLNVKPELKNQCESKHMLKRGNNSISAYNEKSILERATD